MLDYITSYLKSSMTPGQAGNYFWATVYILFIFAGVSVAVMAMNWIERRCGRRFSKLFHDLHLQ